MRKQKGSVTLETSLVLPFFIFLFLFIYSMFFTIRTENEMTHALAQTSKSLSLDSYLNEKVESVANANTFWSGFGDMVIDFVRVGNNKYYSSQQKWYEASNVDENIIKNRFIGYLAGGSLNDAKEKCESLNIVNGLDGIKFETKVENDDLTITIEYKVRLLFDFGGVGEIPIKKTMKSHMWK